MVRSSVLLSLATCIAKAAALQNFTSVVESNPDLSTLTSFLGLYPAFVATLSTLENFTLLAPSNDAFAKFTNSSMAAQLSDTKSTTDFLSYHVLNGTYSLSTLHNGPQFIPTLLVDHPLNTNVSKELVVEIVSQNNDTYVISGLLQSSTIVGPDLTFTGGIVHVIDTVLTIPQNLSTTLVELNLTSAAGALGIAGLRSGGLGLPGANLAAFLPNNAGFAAVASLFPNLSTAQLVQIMDYHLVPNVVDYSTLLANGTLLTTLANEILKITVGDGRLFVDSAEIVVPNVLIQEGILHIIDNLLNPLKPGATPDYHASSQLPAFNGATSLGGGIVPFTSGVPTPSSAISTPTLPLPSGASQPSSTSGSGPNTAPSGIQGTGLSTGGKAGIGVGVSLGAIAAMGIILIFWRKRRSRPPAEVPHQTHTEISPPEKDLAAELPSKRDLVTELPADRVPTKSSPSAPVNSAQAPGLHPVFLHPETNSTTTITAENTPISIGDGTHELDSRTVGPELEGQPKVPKRVRPEPEGYSSFG